MVFQSPGDIFFKTGNFAIYNYGIILALACLVGVLTSYKLFRKYHKNSNSEKILDFSAYCLIAGILGARLYFCLLNPVYYLTYPIEIFNIREGGLSIHGALIGGILALILGAKKYKLGILKTLDCFACGTALAQSIGRWGNFFNSEAFGLPTNLPWKLFIPINNRPSEYVNFEFFHPTFLYESLLDLLMFILLLGLMKKFATRKPGTVLCSYLILYSIIRILIENLRLDSALNILGLPIAQIISVILILIASLGLFIINRR